MLIGKMVKFQHEYSVDRIEREFGKVTLQNGDNVAELLVAEGLAEVRHNQQNKGEVCVFFQPIPFFVAYGQPCKTERMLKFHKCFSTLNMSSSQNLSRLNLRLLSSSTKPLKMTDNVLKKSIDSFLEGITTPIQVRDKK